MRYAFLLVLILGSITQFWASDSTKVRLTTASKFCSDFSEVNEPVYFDTVLQSFYHYELDGRDYIGSLGNPGLSYNSLLFKQTSWGFNSGEGSILDNFKEQDGNTEYHTTVPFARVSYRSGPKKYQDFDVFFTENVNKRLNFAVAYNTQSSTGFYINQVTVAKRFDFQNSFRTKKDKYGYFFKFSVRNGSASENGGIKSDSLYKELTKLSPLDTENNKLKVQVWQENASNFYDFRKVQFMQFFKLSSKRIDSTRSKDLKLGVNTSGGMNDLWFSDEIADSNYFARFGIVVPDSTPVRDKSHLIYSKNEIFIKAENIIGFATIVAGGNVNYYDYTSYIAQNKFYESTAYIKLSNVNIGAVRLNAEGEIGIDGYNSDGHRLRVEAYYKTKDLDVSLSGKNQKTLPEYKAVNYAGNHVNWNNDFNLSGTSGLYGQINWKKFKLSLSGEYELNDNYVYYGNNTQPVQYRSSFGRHYIELKKKIVLGSYHFDLSIVNQGVSNEAPVYLADWIGVISFYYQRFLFKDALELRYGIDYWQHSQYYAQSYSPFTRSFVYQDTYSVGDFPWLNFYISARIKSAQGFVNFQNIGQFVFRENYMMIPDYAMQDFGVSFGLRWDFYN